MLMPTSGGFSGYGKVFRERRQPRHQFRIEPGMGYEPHWKAIMTSMYLVSFLLSLAGAASADDGQADSLRVVPSIDLERYCGTWYEIARLPNSFQNRCVGDVTATYTLLPDGEITVVNRCRTSDGETSEAEGRARRASDTGPNTKLEVRFAPAFLSFLPFVWGDYWIIDLAPDYSYAVIGEPKRRYLWVLARSKEMDEAVLGEILARARAQGYDTTSLIRTSQTR
jgi:apolipoprotein D and lipocalin family protein